MAQVQALPLPAFFAAGYEVRAAARGWPLPAIHGLRASNISYVQSRPDRTRSTVRAIPGFGLGKYWRFREADVLAWIERQRSGERANA